jgi:hypothetical protein
MYHGVYEKLAETGIVEELDDEVWLDRHDNIVETEADVYGRKTKYLLRTQTSIEVQRSYSLWMRWVRTSPGKVMTMLVAKSSMLQQT